MASPIRPAIGDRPFFETLDRFGDRLAMLDSADGTALSYVALEQLVQARAEELGQERKLIFLQAGNDCGSIIDYLAALRGRHAVHLTDGLTTAKMQALIGHYAPHLTIGADRTLTHVHSRPIALHPDLALLLSTSGSTGSPKLVKLSGRNIDSNARAICDYLELTSSERAFQHLKPHYSYGLSVINAHLACGGALILSSESAIEDSFWHAFDAHEATSVAGVPYTFETLRQRGFDPAAHPSLRYATQAGGKLGPALVAAFATAFAGAGKRFYVMYGQTEAAPRISYLPPAVAQRFPGSIGQAIPGGTLLLIGNDGETIDVAGQPGELAYAGPNVMMGYATGPDELATDETPPRLMTGDIAERNEDGLFFITGRKARFVKPFGIRVNLDEVQSFVQSEYGLCAVAGDDAMVVIALEGPQAAAKSLDIAALATRFGLPQHIFAVRQYGALPLLANGKYDLRAILEGQTADRPGPIKRFSGAIKDILGLNRKSYNSVQALFETMLPGRPIDPDLSFSQVALDSLAFVSLSIEIDLLFRDEPPADWQTIPIHALEEAYVQRVMDQVT